MVSYPSIQTSELFKTPLIKQIYILSIVFNHAGPHDPLFATNPFLKIGLGLYYIEKNARVHWFDAYEHCRLLDAELVAFETIEEWNFVSQYLLEHKMNEAYWTSGNDLAKRGNHLWYSTGQPINVDGIWAYNQPDGQELEHCDEMSYGSNPETRGISDVKCSSKRLFMCEKQLLQRVEITVW